MRKSAVYAVKQALAEGFVALTFKELDALEALPSWMSKLFHNLVRFSNFETGRGETTYAALLRRLTPIQPRSGPKHFVPDLQALKKAVRLMEERGLVRRDKLKSQEDGRLIFVVMPRGAKARPTGELEPRTRTPAKRAKAPIHGASEAAGAGTRTPDSNPSSTGCISHIESEQLSPAGGMPTPPEPSNPPGPIDLAGALAAGGEKIGPPRGADHRPQAGTPPRASVTTRAMRERVRTPAPPGGQPDAPQGGGVPMAPSARIRRPRNTGLDEGGRPSAGQGTTTEYRTEGQE